MSNSPAVARPRLRVYLSSTYQDLIEHRRKVDETLRQLGYEVIGMESYVASDARPVDKCLADVRAVDVYVGIFAWRYGFIPPGYDRSITELEYRAASEAGKERLIFLARDDAEWPVDRREHDAAAAIERLHAELRLNHVVAAFSTPDQLATQVATAITASARRRLDAEVTQLRHDLEQAGLERQRERTRVVNFPPLEVARFVNRLPEREALHGYLDDAAVRLVKVVGPAGMGKSALVSSVIGELETHLAEAASSPEAPLPDGIVYLSARTTGLSLESLVADTRKLLSEDDDHSLAEAWTSRDATVEQKVEMFLAAVRHRRYVMVLDAVDVVLDDDLVIQEAGLRVFIEACLRRSGAPLLVITSRLDVLAPPESLSAVRVVKVDSGLDPQSSCALLNNLDPQGEFGLRDAPVEQLERVALLTGGIPRALEVLVGILQGDPTASLERLLDDEEALGERTVEGIVAEGHRRLGDDERRLMQALAVFTKPVPAPAVAFLLHPWYPGIDVTRGLRHLVSSYFVTASRRTGEFSIQALDRDHAYREIPDDAPAGYGRTALELRAADFYCSVRKSPDQWHSLEDLAPQLAELEHCIRGGAYDRALEVLQPVDEQHLALWGYYLRLIDLRRRFLDKAVRPDLRAANLAGLGGCYQVLGQYDTAVEYYLEAVEIARREGDSECEVLYTGNLGRVYRNLGEMDKAVNCLRRTFEFYSAQGKQREIAVWSDRLALGYWHLGLMSDAIALANRSLVLAREVGDGRTEAAVLSNLGLMYDTEGEPDAARTCLTDSLVIARRVGDRRGEAIALGRLGAVALADGDAGTALDRHREALALAQALGERREQSYQLIGLGWSTAAQGDLTGAIEQLRAARDLDVPETSYLAAVRLGLVLLRTHDLPGAATAFEDAGRRCRERLDRCDRLFGTRYALATAMVGVAVCSPGWSDERERTHLLAAAIGEYGQASTNCAGRGVLAATSTDIGAIRDAGIDGLEPVVTLLADASTSMSGR